MIETVVDAVGDRALGIQRGPALADVLEDCSISTDI